MIGKQAHSFFWFCMMLVMMNVPAWGQAGNIGSVEGTVTDQKGGVVPGVTLTLKNTATDATYTATSDETGLFRFPVIPVGTYDLTTQKQGFASVTQKAIQVTVGAKITLPLTLPLAAQTATVVVTSEVPLLETSRTQVSATVKSQSVADLPVLGRNFINFVLLTPGVTLDRRDGDISFAGMRGTLNSLVVDGSDNNNNFFGQTTGRTGSGRAPYQFSQDAVAEFQVNSNSYSAEYGRAGGAVINVVTKSGTNEFHGTAFEFYRDTSLNAEDPISKSRRLPKAPLHFNQFGGNVGGPVVKDHLFFFFDYDGQRNTLPNPVFLNLPTGFTISTDPAIAPFQQDALKYLSARAQSWTRTQNQDVYLGKADWHITKSNLLTGRINSQRFRGANFENGGSQNSLEHTGASNVTTDTVSFTLNSAIRSSLVNVASLTILRDNEPGQVNSANPEATVRQGGTVLIVGRNFFSPRFTNIKQEQLGDALAAVHGRHTIKVGADFIHGAIANFFPGNFSGSFTFNSLESFGRNLDGVAQRVPSDVSYLQAFAGPGTSGPTTSPNQIQVGAFAQDEWRVRPNLILNYGVRYDVQLVAPGTVRNPQAFAAGIDTSRIRPDKNGPEPRLGFAWTPRATNRIVVRGGYGIFYGNTPSIMFGTAMSNNGLNVETLTFSGTSIPQYPNNICGAPGNLTSSPSCAPPTGGTPRPPVIFIVDPSYKQPFVQQWSLGTEYEVAHDLSLAVSYLGVKGTHLQRTRDINLDPALITSTILINNTPVPFQSYSSVRPIAGFGRILQFEGSANSIYNGLTLQLTKRFSHGVEFLGSYTFGHAIDDNPDATAVVPGSSDDGKMVNFPTNPALDHGSGQNDQRQRFVFSWLWDLNTYARGLTGPAKVALGGWELSGIFTAQNGQPYSGLVSADLNNDGNTRTDRTPGTGRDIFKRPGQVSLDPRITKDLFLGERMKFQLILEAFNALNRTNVLEVSNTQYSKTTCGGVACLVASPTFGTPTTSTFAPISPRILQLGVKFIF